MSDRETQITTLSDEELDQVAGGDAASDVQAAQDINQANSAEQAASAQRNADKPVG